ncbi:hypothetical protein SAMN02910447_00684 [Ruminococcus sp. YE71]|uniref:hypothetical protein n=1 Tax=unclassified Ruminococcus TaxID=2608920 RepID=UPI00088A9AB1|nr:MULTISPECIES: hypothetical protein [unclassified Ruminococcus]SDA13571.1 hypothetical protein SAMN02910446_00683 [Ruminococcus sp. YE78]SFW19310.1 hypothetical protein SAMN02910447_00684 [Ruminococcus sp. YE71]
MQHFNLENGQLLKNGAPILTDFDEVKIYSHICVIFRKGLSLLTISIADIAMGRFEIIDDTGFSKQLLLTQTSSKIV